MLDAVSVPAVKSNADGGDETDEEFLRRPVVVLNSNFRDQHDAYMNPYLGYPAQDHAGFLARRERSWHAEKDLFADPLAQLRMNPPETVDEDYKVHVGMDEALGRAIPPHLSYQDYVKPVG